MIPQITFKTVENIPVNNGCVRINRIKVGRVKSEEEFKVYDYDEAGNGKEVEQKVLEYEDSINVIFNAEVFLDPNRRYAPFPLRDTELSQDIKVDFKKGDIQSYYDSLQGDEQARLAKTAERYVQTVLAQELTNYRP